MMALRQSKILHHLFRGSQMTNKTSSAFLFPSCFAQLHQMSDENDKRQFDVGILGAPIHTGQFKKGVDDGPEAIREAGLFSRLNYPTGMKIHDYGNLDFPPYPGDPSDVYQSDSLHTSVYHHECNANSNHQLASKVETILNDCDICVTLGGDHSISIGTISGHAHVEPDLSVLWVDAHPDLHSPETTTSGKLHGMPVHFLLKELSNMVPYLPAFKWISPILCSSNLAYIAIRDIEPGEIARLKRYNIPHYSTRDIDRYGIAKCMEQIQDKINKSGNRSIHLSYDIDALDPKVAPSTGTKVMGGLTLREALFIAEEIYRSGCLRAIDLSEFNPEIGSERDALHTAKVCVEIIAHALGCSIRDTEYRKDG